MKSSAALGVYFDVVLFLLQGEPFWTITAGMTMTTGTTTGTMTTGMTTGTTGVCATSLHAVS